MSNELAVKFSDETYATYQEVVNYMKTPLIDNIWANIIEHRSHFNKQLSLKHITGANFSVCYTPYVTNKINEVERKLLKLTTSYFQLSAKKADKEYLKLSYTDILRSLATKYKLDVDDSVLNQIVTNQLSVLPPNFMILNRYFRCLKEIENNPLSEVNDSILGDFYSYLMGTDELNEFYRTSEISDMGSKVLVGKVYLGIPSSAIGNSMDDLFKFINYSTSSLFVKAAASLYYMYYVKPFETYSEDMSILLFKKIIGFNDIGSVASTIDFESLLINREEFEKSLIDSQKTFDLTYFVLYIANKTSALLDKALNNVNQARNTVISQEMYEKEEEKPVIDPDFSVGEKVDNSGEINKKETAPINNPIQYKPADTPSPVSYTQSIAISNVPSGLSEEDATRLENHLIEMNPALSRAQAYFYARHCTLGMSYTISQFKKSLGCAYETARSSMDHLVFLGYYKKDSLRNKFIYTPVKKN
jgi:hypothetical protein